MNAPALRLVNTETGEFADGCPTCPDKDETIAALQAEVTRQLRRNAKLQREVHQERGMDPEAESVRRVYAKWRELCKPRAAAKIPADRLTLGLERRKTFTEAQMLMAVHGAASPDATNAKTGVTYDKWETVFRNTGNTEMYMEFGEKALGVKPAGGYTFAMRILATLRAADLFVSQDGSWIRGSCPLCMGDLQVVVQSGLPFCRNGCSTTEVDVALERLAERYWIRLGL